MSTDMKNAEPKEPIAPETATKDATVWELAQIIANSRDFPECRSPEKAAVRILAGREMGVGPIASVLGIRIQAGRVSMDAALMAGAIKRSDYYDYSVREHTAQKCVLEFSERCKVIGTSEFSMEDAAKAGLSKKETWRAYPRNMLFARALSNGARWYCPAIFGGAIYSHEELGYTVDDEGRASGDDAAGTGGGLCTREQRKQIIGLAETAGQKLPDLMADMGIRLLDELSGYEAGRLIGKLTKQAEKAAGTMPAETKPEPADVLREALGSQGCSPEQRQRIMDLAERLEPDEEERVGMIVAILEKRGAAKILDLTTVQATALIEAMEARLASEPPFDASQPMGST